MNTKSFLLTAFAFGALLVGAFFVTSETSAKQNTTQASNNALEYAVLTETSGVYTFQAGDTNVRPQNRSLRALYRELGGRRQDTFVNLLNRIGASGWQLVETREDEGTFTRVFFRR